MCSAVHEGDWCVRKIMKVNDVLRCGPWTCYCCLLSGPIATKYHLDFRFMRCSNVHYCVLGNYGVFTFSRVRIGSFSTLGGKPRQPQLALFGLVEIYNRFLL